ncbi:MULTISPECIES: universal stress protein [unclassified Kitasatospora]|uniref:universal stress protein n=1 Tax=unclassified Kitasatospora TaxID=2633591 RepID=UPI0033E96D86
MRPEIVVGLDGTPESLSAANWAAREAKRHGFTLRLLHVWITAPGTPAESPDMPLETVTARRVLQDAETDLQERYPYVPVTSELLAADSSVALLETAAKAELLVLGSQSLGSAQGYLLGSLTLQAVAGCERPVVLVRTEDQPDDVRSAAGQPGAVVVGVSLRPGYDGTLAFAFDAAARRSATLVAFLATNRRRSVVLRERPPKESEELAAHQALGAALRPWHEKYPYVRVVEQLSHESPGRALVDSASGARLLVVGRGGHRNPLTPRIGPVTHAAIHHAACPVVIIPHD